MHTAATGMHTAAPPRHTCTLQEPSERLLSAQGEESSLTICGLAPLRKWIFRARRQVGWRAAGPRAAAEVQPHWLGSGGGAWQHPCSPPLRPPPLCPPTFRTGRALEKHSSTHRSLDARKHGCCASVEDRLQLQHRCPSRPNCVLQVHSAHCPTAAIHPARTLCGVEKKLTLYG